MLSLLSLLSLFIFILLVVLLSEQFREDTSDYHYRCTGYECYPAKSYHIYSPFNQLVYHCCVLFYYPNSFERIPPTTIIDVPVTSVTQQNVIIIFSPFNQLVDHCCVSCLLSEQFREDASDYHYRCTGYECYPAKCDHILFLLSLDFFILLFLFSLCFPFL